jgi:hypothetical protein
LVKRWSSRKLGQAERPNAPSSNAPKSNAPDLQNEAVAPSKPADAAGAPAVPQEEALANVDFSTLDFASDFVRFMKSGVPDEVRTKALRMLWSSHETIGRPDDLDDYLEDFSEQAMGLPAELAKSAYEIGRGFVTAEEAKAASPTPGVQDDQSSSVTAELPAPADETESRALSDREMSAIEPSAAEEKVPATASVSETVARSGERREAPTREKQSR